MSTSNMSLKLTQIKTNIENMDKIHQVEILRIFKNSKDVFLNENSNGIFINLTGITDGLISQIEKYIYYVKEQKQHLEEAEQLKDNIKTNYFQYTSCVNDTDNIKEYANVITNTVDNKTKITGDESVDNNVDIDDELSKEIGLGY